MSTSDEQNPPGSNDAPTEAAPAAEPSAVDETTRLQQVNADLKDRLLRTAADFENWKKRAKKEGDEAQTRGREALLKEILPVIDNFERALQHASDADPLAAGVKMVEKQLLTVLEKFGVTRFSAVGKPFDPALHEAIQQVETAAHAPGTVASEFASGYMAGPRLLRPALVAVAKAPSVEAPGPDGQGQ